jgi:RNA polymerase sigma-70 factor (ECF subfamily)
MTLVADPGQQTEVDDVELLRRIAAGERDALTSLYERHAPWLTVRLSRRCDDDDLVDTAVQDTFLAVWRQADRYRPSGEVGAWIWTIGVRRLIDQLRRRPPPEPVDDVTRLVAVVTDEIPLALGHTPLGQVFGSLDPELQVVLAATALDGLSNREAGVLLGIPTGTVKSRLARARRLVKEAMS